jgi:NitT/TauT family transport system substrate-binding protein
LVKTADPSGMTRRVLLGLVALVTATSLACAPQPVRQPGRPAIRFGYDLWAGYYPALIAKELGYFRDEGIEVVPIHPEHTDVMMSDFAAGQYDAIAVAFGDVLAIAQASPDIRVVLHTDESFGADAIVAKASIQRVRDLRGKRLGVNLGSFSEVLTERMLELNGMTPDDVHLVDSDAAKVPELLTSGALDAGHTWEPYLTQAVQAGGRVLFTSAETPGLIPDVVAFRGEFVRQHPEAVRGFVHAWLRAADWWFAHPDSGQVLAARALGCDTSETAPRGIKLKRLEDNRRVFADTSSVSLRKAAKRYLDFYARVGTVRAAPDLDRMLDPEFLPR